MIKWWAEKFQITDVTNYLFDAVKNGGVDLLVFLEEKGAKFDETHLFYAMNNENIEVLAYLLKKKRCKFWRKQLVASFLLILITPDDHWEINHFNRILSCKYAHEHGCKKFPEFPLLKLISGADEFAVDFRHRLGNANFESDIMRFWRERKKK
jgi:hypothetical protein